MCAAHHSDLKKLRTDLIIRHFEVLDQDQCKKVILEGLGEHFENLDLTINSDLENIHSHYVEPGHVFMVAEMDGLIVGTGGLVRERNGDGRLVRLSVSNPHRRNNIGREIVYNLIGNAVRLGIPRLVVETNHDWIAAIHLYESCGFIEYDRDEISVHMTLPLT